MVVFVWNTPDTVSIPVILFAQIMLEIEHSLSWYFEFHVWSERLMQYFDSTLKGEDLFLWADKSAY